MQLKMTDLVAVKSTGLLPVFGYALAAALIIGLASGGYVAWKWKAGAHAIAENTQLRADAAEWARIAKEQREIASDQALQMKAALGRLGAIAQGREDDRESIRQFVAQQSAALELLRLERPDLGVLNLGPEFLRHWNKANAGPGTAAPASGPGSEPAPAVPGAAGGDQPQSPGRAGTARPGISALSRLPQQDGAPDPGQRRMAGHRLAVVLHGGEADRHRRGWMPA